MLLSRQTCLVLGSQHDWLTDCILFVVGDQIFSFVRLSMCVISSDSSDYAHVARLSGVRTRIWLIASNCEVAKLGTLSNHLRCRAPGLRPAKLQTSSVDCDCWQVNVLRECEGIL